MMHTDLIKATIEQCANQPLFEVCYVRGIQATYALYDQSEDFGQPIFYKTINLLTREMIDSGCDKRFWGDGLCALRTALDAAYNADRILEDAVGQSYELLSNLKSGMCNLDHMHDHIVFGQSVYYGDVDELSWKCGEHTYTVGMRIGGNDRNEGWMIIDGDGRRTEIVIPLTA